MSSKITRAAVRLGLLTSIVLSAAAVVLAQDVNYNAMPGSDFSKYKTYKWVKIEGATAPDQILDQQIKTAIDKQLASKGLTKVDGDNADLYVAYQVAVNQEKQWNTYGTGVGYGAGWYGGGMGTVTSETIHVGTLGLDMYDVGQKQLVWRGTASKTLDPGANPEKRQKNIDKAMAKLLKNFPPPEKKK